MILEAALATTFRTSTAKVVAFDVSCAGLTKCMAGWSSQKKTERNCTMTSQNTTQNQANDKGTPLDYFEGFVVREFRNAGKKGKRWVKIGVMFPHEKGDGFNTILDATPTDGEITWLRAYSKPKKDDTSYDEDTGEVSSHTGASEDGPAPQEQI